MTDLAHELFHGLDANRGIMNDKDFKGVSRNEWQATYRENVLRGQLGKPLRTYYNVIEDTSHNLIGGDGPRMITPSNQPIYPIGPIPLL